MARFILSAFADEASPSVEKQIEALHANGIKGVELRGVNGKSVKDLTLEEARAVSVQLAEAGITVTSMGSPFGKIGINDDFGAHFEEFRHALELCRILGTSRMRVFSFYIPAGEDPAKYRDEVLRRLSLMLDAAEKENILLCHENEKGIYGDIGDRCVDLASTLGSSLGVVFDPANFIQCGDLPSEQFQKLEGFITYMHIKDALMADGSVVPSGHGDGTVEDILRAMSLREGDIVLSLEPHLTVFDGLKGLQGEELKHKYTYPDSNTAFKAAADALKTILTDIGYKEENGTWIK